MTGVTLPDVVGLSLAEAAKVYAGEGISVFPLAQRSKRPIHMGGFLQATDDIDQVVAWWDSHPDANIGAVPGFMECIVPDIDTEEAWDAWFERVGVDTAATLTGGGQGIHPWYHSLALSGRSHWRLDEEGGPFQDPRLGNLLFRASGGYVILAPSIHPETGSQYRLQTAGVAISALPRDIERMLLSIPSREAGAALPVDAASAVQFKEDFSAPTTSAGGAAILQDSLAIVANSDKNARNDTLMAQVGVLLNAAYLWPINLDEAREAFREVYVPHVADTRKAAQANREVDHAFDYIMTQRIAEGPPDEVGGGKPIKPRLKQLALPAPVTAEDRHKAILESDRADLLDIGALLSGDLPEIEWLVDGFIAKDRMTSIVAEAKSGKSLLMLDIAASLACNTPTLGKSFGRPVKVLYLDYEMTAQDVQMRLMDMGFDQAFSELGLLTENMKYWQLPVLDPLDTEEGGRRLMAMVEAVQAELIIVDTMAAAIEGPENDADTYRRAANATWRPLKGMGVTVVRIDHLGKDRSRGARGSSAKRDDVDVAWELTAVGDRLTLKRTHTRLPGSSDDKIIIQRHTGKLNHVREGTQKWTQTAITLAQAINAANIDIDKAGVKLGAMLRKANIKFDNSLLSEAKDYLRQGMPGVGPAMVTPIQSSGGGEDPSGTVTPPLLAPPRNIRKVT